MRLSTLFPAFLLCAGAAFVSSPVWACSFGADFAGALEIRMEDPPADFAAPPKPSLALEGVTRGGLTSDSCADIGAVGVSIRDFDDENHGVRFEVQQSTVGELGLPVNEPERVRDTRLTLVWIDGDSYEQEPLAMEFRAIAVDEWGRESEPSEWLIVQDPGRPAEDSMSGEEGCSTTSGSPSAMGSALPLLGLLFFVRRRR